MKKLIDITQGNFLVCDNECCDFELPNVDVEGRNTINYINKPCPKCGDNLLTVKDYLNYERFLRFVEWINKWFSWLTLLSFSNKKTKIGVKIHNGIRINTDGSRR